MNCKPLILYIGVSLLFLNGCKLFDGAPTVNVQVSPTLKDTKDNGLEANNNRVEKGAFQVNEGALKGLEVNLGSVPVVTVEWNAPMIDRIVVFDAKVDQEIIEWDYYPDGKPRRYKHIYPNKSVKQTPADKFMSFILTSLPSWFVAIVLLATLIFFAYKKFIKKGETK